MNYSGLTNDEATITNLISVQAHPGSQFPRFNRQNIASPSNQPTEESTVRPYPFQRLESAIIECVPPNDQTQELRILAKNITSLIVQANKNIHAETDTTTSCTSLQESLVNQSIQGNWCDDTYGSIIVSAIAGAIGRTTKVDNILSINNLGNETENEKELASAILSSISRLPSSDTYQLLMELMARVRTDGSPKSWIEDEN